MCLRTAVLWPVHGKRFQKERRGNRKTRGQERRIKEAGLHRSEQAAFHGTCLSGWFKVRRYLLLVHKRPCAPSSAGRALSPRLSDSLIPFSSSHKIHSKRCKISTAKVDCYTGPLQTRPAAEQEPALCSISGPARIPASYFPKPRSCCGFYKHPRCSSLTRGPRGAAAARP